MVVPIFLTLEDHFWRTTTIGNVLYGPTHFALERRLETISSLMHRMPWRIREVRGFEHWEVLTCLPPKLWAGLAILSDVTFPGENEERWLSEILDYLSFNSFDEACETYGCWFDN